MESEKNLVAEQGFLRSCSATLGPMRRKIRVFISTGHWLTPSKARRANPARPWKQKSTRGVHPESGLSGDSEKSYFAHVTSAFSASMQQTYSWPVQNRESQIATLANYHQYCKFY